MHPPDEVLWGNAPGSGPALRKAVERTIRESRKRAWPLRFYLWCVIALVVFFIIGTLRLLIFGPWWVAAHSAAASAPRAPVHREAVTGHTNSHPRKHVKPQTPQPAQAPR